MDVVFSDHAGIARHAEAHFSGDQIKMDLYGDSANLPGNVETRFIQVPDDGFTHPHSMERICTLQFIFLATILN